jgi:hypothetical protein
MEGLCLLGSCDAMTPPSSSTFGMFVLSQSCDYGSASLGGGMWKQAWRGVDLWEVVGVWYRCGGFDH